jgi:hypothetical protein
VHEALALARRVVGALEQRVRVPEEEDGGEEARDVDGGVPGERDEGPGPGRERQGARGRRGARPLPDGARARRRRRHGRQPRGVGGAPGAGHEEREQRHAVAERVVHADRRGGGGLGGWEVEDVELPERAGLVHGQRRQRRHVVLHGPVRVARHHRGVQPRVDDVVVQVHRRRHPSRTTGPVLHLATTQSHSTYVKNLNLAAAFEQTWRCACAYLDAAEARVARELGLDAGAGGGEVHGRGDPDHDDDVEVLHQPRGGAHELPVLPSPGGGERAVAPGRVHRERPLPQGGRRRRRRVHRSGRRRRSLIPRPGARCRRTGASVLHGFPFPTQDDQWCGGYILI